MVLVALNYMCGLKEPVEKYLYNTWIRHLLKLPQRFFDDLVHFLDPRDSIARTRNLGIFFLYLQFKGWITSYTRLSRHEYFINQQGKLVTYCTLLAMTSLAATYGAQGRLEAAGIGVWRV